jgi:cyclase
VVGIGALTMAVAAFQAPPQPQGPNVAGIEKVKDNLYMITGGGGNTAAFVTANGVVVVDTKLANWGQAILDKIRSVTDKPVTMIINTHTHGDHVGSNSEFPATVDIVAHENTKTNMTKMPAFAGANQQYLPKRTFADRMTLLGGSDRIDLYYFGRGHTNGDAIIVFPALRTAHTGDLFSAKGTPIIDTNNGGSGVEYPETVAKLAAGVQGVDTVIPGHAPVTDWQAVHDFAGFMQEIVTAVQQGKQQGRTADQIADGLKLSEKYRDWNLGRAKANVTTIYGELP